MLFLNVSWKENVKTRMMIPSSSHCKKSSTNSSHIHYNLCFLNRIGWSKPSCRRNLSKVHLKNSHSYFCFLLLLYLISLLFFYVYRNLLQRFLRTLLLNIPSLCKRSYQARLVAMSRRNLLRDYLSGKSHTLKKRRQKIKFGRCFDLWLNNAGISTTQKKYFMLICLFIVLIYKKIFQKIWQEASKRIWSSSNLNRGKQDWFWLYGMCIIIVYAYSVLSIYGNQSFWLQTLFLTLIYCLQ